MDDDLHVYSDAELVARACSGEREAFAAIYDRYADRVHDFCCSVLRNRDEAADAMQDTFVLASQRLGQLQDPTKLRPWLFAIARYESIRRGKARRRMAPSDRLADEPVDDTGAEDAVRRDDAESIVWAAAAGLSARDRALLDLHLRQGLDGQELADAIGVSAPHAYTLMNRLREQVERSLGALLVARLGRDDCTQLQTLLAQWDGRFTPLWRKRVARHVDGCDVCSERRRVLASPMALLAAAPLVPAPLALRSLTLDRVDALSDASAATDLDGDGSGGGATDGAHGWPDPEARHGFPPGIDERRRALPRDATRKVAAIVGAAVLALVVFGASYFLFQDDEPATTQVAATSATTRPVNVPDTALVPGPSTTTSTPTSSTERSERGDDAPPARDAVEEAPRSTSTTTSTTLPRDVTGPVLNASVATGELWEDDPACGATKPASTTASATVQDSSGVKSVVISYTVGAVSMSQPMNLGATATATVGTFPVGTVQEVESFTVQVTAVDNAGNSTSATIPMSLHPATECAVIL
jgi:RNA polymerase sigma factor (sigma-70 family)